MERIADDAAALLDHLGLARAVVVGCSMGGYAAFAMVRRHPDRLRGLVLQDTRAGADTEEARKSRALLAEKTLREGATRRPRRLPAQAPGGNHEERAAAGGRADPRPDPRHLTPRHRERALRPGRAGRLLPHPARDPCPHPRRLRGGGRDHPGGGVGGVAARHPRKPPGGDPARGAPREPGEPGGLQRGRSRTSCRVFPDPGLRGLCGQSSQRARPRTAVGRSAPRSRPRGEMPSSKCRPRMAWPAGFGALAMTVRPPRPPPPPRRSGRRARGRAPGLVH